MGTNFPTKAEKITRNVQLISSDFWHTVWTVKILEGKTIRMFQQNE